MLNSFLNEQKLTEFSPVRAYQLDADNDDLDIERRSRNDILFNIDPLIDIDILCEELIHKVDISDISIEKLVETSEQELHRIEDAIGKYVDVIKTKYAKLEANFKEHPRDSFHAEYNRLNMHDYISSETAFSKTLDNEIDPIKKSEMVNKHCTSNIYDLRNLHYGIADTDVKKTQIEAEIRKMVLNIRNFRYASMRRNGNDLFTRLLSIDLTTLNNVTILNSNKVNAEDSWKLLETSINNKKFMHEILAIVSDPNTDYAFKQAVLKLEKIYDQVDPIQEKKFKKAYSAAKASYIPVAYSTWNGARPSTDFGDYEYWNGLQAFDIDIKFDEVNIPRVQEIKKILHKALKKYNWYLGVKNSVSGKGLHILTKVRPMHKLYADIDNNLTINKFWFMMSYYSKFTAIKWLLLNKCEISPNKIHLVIDKSMMKISQGIVLNFDPNAMWNDKFLDLPIFFGMSIPPISGLKHEEWLLDSDNLKYVLTVKASKSKGHESINHLRKRTEHVYDAKPIYDTISYEFTSASIPDDLSRITPIDETKFDTGDRDFMRHKLIRTVIYIYGANDKSKELCRRLLNVPNVFSEGELYGKWKYAERKPFVFEQSMNLMKQSGCHFEIDSDILNKVKDSKLQKAAESLKETAVVFNETMPDYSFNLDVKKPYLGYLKNDILEVLEKDKVNVLEAAPGKGKTTLFNLLAKEMTILLVEPYVSVLQNKIEKDEESSKYFDVCYGSKRIVIEKGRSVATTFDKLANLTEEELRNFDIVAVDESHLLFSSTYRDRVTTKVANNVTKFVTNEIALKEQMTFEIGLTSTSEDILENTTLFKTMQKIGTKIVLMTGTITGELLYFERRDVLNYIKINSKHTFEKHAQFMLADSNKNKLFGIAVTIANAIREGKKVIVPTNSGDSYVAAVLAQVNHILKDEALQDHEWTYYRKSNSENHICKSINDHSVLPKEAKLLFCTVYLGVGVDILNECKFLVVFDGDETTAQDVEQFNNRIRRSDIDSTIVYSAFTTGIDGQVQIKKSIYDTPSEIELKMTADHINDIADDRRIAIANARISAGNAYNKYKLPAHLRFSEMYHDQNGSEVSFNEDKFIIRGFSHDYNKIAAGAAYTKYVLTNYYDYSVSYKLFVMDDNDLILTLQEVAKEAKKSVMTRKAQAFMKTATLCAEHFDKIEHKKLVDFVEVHENEFFIEIAPSTNLEKKWTLTYAKEYEEQVKSAYTNMRKLLRVYNPETSLELLLKHVSDTGKINFTELGRDLQLIDFMHASTNSNMLLASSDAFVIIEDFIEKEDAIIFVDDNRMLFDEYTFRSLKMNLLRYADSYFTKITEDMTLQTAKMRESLFAKIDETLKVFLKIRKTKDGDYGASYRQVPQFNNQKSADQSQMNDIIMKYLVENVIQTETIELHEIDLHATTERNATDYALHVESIF